MGIGEMGVIIMCNASGHKIKQRNRFKKDFHQKQEDLLRLQ